MSTRSPPASSTAAKLTADDALVRLRALCFGLPAVEEKLSHGAPSWFVRGKMFATFADDHHGDGRTAAWVKAEPEQQRELVAESPARYFVPPYVGVKGWLGVHLAAQTDWDALTLILEEAWTQVAPKSAALAPVLPPPQMAPLAQTDPAVSAAAMARIEAICADLSDVEIDRDKWNATFRVKKKPFLYFNDNHHGDGVIGAWVKVPVGAQATLAAKDPARYFIPAYLGARGWLGIRLDGKRVDWKDVAARIAESHASQSAPPPKKPKSAKKKSA